MQDIGKRLKEYRLAKGLQQGEFADMLKVKKQQRVSNYERGTYKPDAEFLNLLSLNSDINIHWLLTGQGDMLRSGSSDSVSGCYFVPYWNGCSHCSEKTRKKTIKEGISISVDVITKEWGCNKEDVRLIACPGEEMDGGKYPIRNDDLLVIDVSKTNISDSGIYLITTNNCETVALRRLMELVDGSVAFYIDNKEYSFAVNKTYSREELDAMDFKVIGRVIKNITYTL